MVEKANYQVFACAIMPEHVHMVLGRYRYKVETMMRLLKAEASATLREDKLHPMQTWPLEEGTLHTPWAEKGWKVFLDSVEDIDRAVGYVEDNPEKEGRLRKLWPFIVPWRSVV
jgi:REP element-mobilizing transposase RayT